MLNFQGKRGAFEQEFELSTLFGNRALGNAKFPMIHLFVPRVRPCASRYVVWLPLRVAVPAVRP